MSNLYGYYYGNQNYSNAQRDLPTAQNDNLNYATAGSSTGYQQDRSSSGAVQQQQSTYQSYSQPQQTYGAQQWYAANTDGTARAAETLTSMQSNVAQQSRVRSPAVTQQYQTPATNAYAYSSATTAPSHNVTASSSTYGYPSVNQQTPHQYTHQTPYTTQDRQARPSSVNSIRSQSIPHQSPAVDTFNRAGTVGAQSGQYGPEAVEAAAYSHSSVQGRTLDTAAAARSAHSQQVSHSAISQPVVSSASASTPYYTHQPVSATVAVGNTVGRINQSSSSTVDPVAVYDPWPEYQRKADAARAVKAAKEAQLAKEKAEEERRAQELREKEEAALRMAEDAARQAAEETRREADEHEARKEAKRLRKNALRAEKRKKEKAEKAVASGVLADQPSLPVSEVTTSAQEAETASEAALRELMAKIRRINESNPSLVAKIWEEERQSHIERTQTPTQDIVAAISQSSQPVTASQPPPSAQRPPQSTLSMQQSQNVASVEKTRTFSKPLTPSVGAVGNSGKRISTTPIPLPSSSSAATATRTPQPPTVGKTATKLSVAGTTAWPPERRGELAIVASEWINKYPSNSNSNLHIGPFEIEQMLNTNPSYIKLCEKVEAKGFKLDRAKFARALLAVLPGKDNKGAELQTKPPTQGSRDMTSSTPEPPPNVSVASAIPQPIRPVANMTAPRGPAPPLQLPQPGPFIPYQMQPAQHTESSERMGSVPSRPSEAPKEPTIPTPPPANKHEAARKRNISELIDLTANSDDDDFLPPPKRLTQYPPLQRAPYPQQPPSQPQYPSMVGPPQLTQYVPDMRGYMYQPVAVSNQMQMQSNWRLPPPPGPSLTTLPPMADDKFKNHELGKLVERRQALRRNQYNPSTIARDVLLATGRHPELRALNAHLDNLRTAYPRKIMDYTDLSTIRWDLIDPGEPVTLPTADADKDSVLDEGDADDESEDDVLPAEPSSAKVKPPHRPETTARDVVNPKAANAPVKQQPRGRKSLQAASTVAGTDGASDAVKATSTPLTRKGKITHTPSQSSNKMSKPNTQRQSYAEYRAMMAAAGTPISGRGRPVGWRKNPADMPAPGEVPQRAVPTISKPKSVGVAVLPKATNPIFACKWDGCKAELHNLDTLRRHVMKVHSSGRSSTAGDYACAWDDCGKAVVSRDPITKKPAARFQRETFETVEEWQRHIKRVHITPISWELGDGPTGGLSGAESSSSEAYLSNSRGRTVTPRVIVPTSPRTEYLQNSQPIPSVVPKYPKLTPEEKAQEYMANAIRKRKMTGVFDIGGSRMVNDRRRRAFQGNKDDVCRAIKKSEAYADFRSPAVGTESKVVVDDVSEDIDME